MSSLTELRKEKEVVTVLGQLVQVYEQIYVTKMQKLRDGVLGSRQYTEGLGDLYNELRVVYGNEVAKIMKSKGNKKGLLKFLKRDEEIAVLLSNTQRISSEINNKVFNAFWDYISAHNCKVLIVGEKGYNMYLARGGSKSRLFYFQVASEDDVQLKEIAPVMNELRNYKNVRLFYARYISLITQVESQSTLGDGVLLEKSEYENKLIDNKSKMDFLTEPSIKQLVDYFETEIFGSLLRQSYSESYLAHVGSRITALESAVGKISDKVNALTHQERKMIRRKKNRKQLAALAGMSFWGVR